MQYKDTRVSNLINKITFKDVLFKGNYTLDPYQNCSFGCAYCDSAYENTIYVKTNAVELFKQEVPTIQKGRIIIGSVHDPYQPIEQKVRLTRDILEVVKEYDMPIHILTKSPLIKRDIDILQQIHDVLVTITIFTSDQKISNLFEPLVPSPLDRFQMVSNLQSHHIKTGIALIPIMPYITDGTIEEFLITSALHHANHIIYKHLELKGDQKQIMLHLIGQIDPTLPSKYEQLYADSYAPHDMYIAETNKHIQEICRRLRLPTHHEND
jgi:DNA repair photolyase